MHFNFPYLLLFIPLIASCVNHLLSSKKLHLSLTIATLSSVVLIAGSLMPFVISNGAMVSQINEKPLFLLGEYRINSVNIFFIVITFLVKLADLFRYNKKLMGLEGLANKRFFYVVYLLNCFAIVGTLMTNNIFNLFIFLEIYSFTFYAMISNYKDYNLSVIALKYFLTGVFGSILIFLSVFGLYLTFGVANMSRIVGLMSGATHNRVLLSVLFLMFVFGIFSKFLTFWIYFSKIRKANATSNFLFVSLMFTHIFLGTYLLLKLIYSIFGMANYTHLHLNYLFSFLGVLLVSYYSYSLIKAKNLFYIVMNFSLIDLGYIFLNLGINNLSSLNSVFMFLLNHALINLFIFLIASFLIYNYKSADISFLKAFEKYRYFILLIFCAKLFFPFSVNFVGDMNFIKAIHESRQYYAILPFVFNKVTVAYLIGKIHATFAIGLLREKMRYDKFNIINRNYSRSFIALFALIAFSVFYSPMINGFASHLSEDLVGMAK